MWLEIFGVVNPSTYLPNAIPLLINGLACKHNECVPGDYTYELQKALDEAVRAGRLPRGYMRRCVPGGCHGAT